MSRPQLPLDVYFWHRVAKGLDCWEWIGSKCKGYGRVRRGAKGVSTPAHRVAWELTNGPIPAGMFVCHHCDNRSCVNPAHLFIGTQIDNMQDWTKKGKNRLVNEPALWSKGQHMKKLKYRQQAATRQQLRFKNGSIIALREPSSGRIRGTECVY